METEVVRSHGQVFVFYGQHTILGHVVSKDGISMDESKVEAVR